LWFGALLGGEEREVISADVGIAVIVVEVAGIKLACLLS